MSRRSARQPSGLRRAARGSRSATRKRSHQRRLIFEPLEARRLLALVTVGNDSDLVNGNVASISALIANPGSDGISLREAILAANETPGPDEIQFSPAILNGGTATILTSSELSISDSLTINGLGANVLTIDASGGDPTPGENNDDGHRVFLIQSSSLPIDVTISGLSITGGESRFADDLGAGILNFGNLTLRAVSIYGNRGHVTGDIGRGGAIASLQGMLRVDSSAIFDNDAAVGGGILNEGSMTVVNSTISGNRAEFVGGGISHGFGDATISHSTITLNRVGSGEGGSGINSGDGVQIHSSIVAGNFANDDVRGGFTSLGFNLIGGGPDSGAFDLSEVGFFDPMLAPLAIQGGTTPAHSLLSNSPALGTGDPDAIAGVGLVPLYDQRGDGFSRVRDGRIDIGALEGEIVNNDPVLSNPGGKTTNEGSSFRLDGLFNFTDADSGDTHTATVDWGDGSGVQSATVNPTSGGGNIVGSHTYADEGTYTLRIRVFDNQGGNDEETITVTVNNVAPTLIAAANQTAHEGVPLVLTGVGTPSLGLYVDPGILDAHTATVNWGDGSPVESPAITTAPESGSGLLAASHTYNNTGTYTVTVTVTDDSNATNTKTFTVFVINAPPTLDSLSVTPTINEGQSAILSGTYSDLNPSDTHQLDIDWDGDNIFDQTITVTGGTFSVSRLYADDHPTGTASDVVDVNVRLRDNDSLSVLGSVQLTVNNVLPVLSVASDQTVNVGALLDLATGNTLGAFADAGVLDTHTATVNWGDNSPVATVGVTEQGGSGVLAGTHMYAAPGTFQVTVTLRDDDGGERSATFMVEVVEMPSLIVTTSQDVAANDGQTSLREAIVLANSSPGADTITFDVGLSGQTIELTQGELMITEALEIDATSLASRVTIDARQQSRIFNITATSGDFRLAGLVVTRGQTVGDDDQFDATPSGGAIRSMTEGELVLDRSFVSSSRTLGDRARGGAIYAQGNVTLTQTTVIGNSTAGEDARGGGIYTSEKVTLIESIVSGNSTTGDFADGGGFHADTAVIEKSEIRNNSTFGEDADGGGMRVFYDVEIVETTISGNTASGVDSDGGGLISFGYVRISQSVLEANSAAGRGGAVLSGSSGPSLLFITASVITGNTAGGSGGGIFKDNDTATITESTISGNSAGGSGGGFYIYDGVATIDNSSILANASYGGGGIYARDSDVTISGTTLGLNNGGRGGFGGGAIWATYDPDSDASGQLRIVHSTIYQNSAYIGAGGLLIDGDIVAEVEHTIIARNEIFSSFADLALNTPNVPTFRYNLIESTAGLSDAVLAALNAGPGNILETAPLVAALANNGGATPTYAPLPGSPAINAGDAFAFAGENGVPEFDQRGSEFSRVAYDRIDIGAVEFGGPIPTNFVVDITDDELDGDFSPGDLSLREAIWASNFDPEVRTITFDPGLSGQTIVLTLGELTITDSVTIDATALLGGLTIDASGNDPAPAVDEGNGSRIFSIDDLDYENLQNVTIAGLTLTGGDADGDGGAIFSAENLTLRQVEISGNSATARGGGIYSIFGDLTIQNSTLSGNRAGVPAGGGGLPGFVTIPRGGAIYSQYGRLTISNSTISGNAAEYGGGVFAYRGDVIISGSTFGENTATTHGGGVWIENDADSAQVVDIRHSTIYRNGADTSGSGLLLNGRLDATISHTIIAGALPSGPAHVSFSDSTSIRFEYSLIGSTNGLSPSDVNLLNAGTGNILNQAPRLGGLAINGGTTRTYAILPGSPALNAGDPAATAGENGVPLVDQRGGESSRKRDGRIDIGAFEVQNDRPQVTVPGPQSLLEGAVLDLSTLVSFTDVDLDDLHTATVNWGDGSGDEAVEVDEENGSGNVAGTHAFADDGKYLVTVTVRDEYGEDTKEFEVTVVNVAPTLIVTPLATAVNEGQSVGFSATFSDPGFDNPDNPNGASFESFRYFVDWGDRRDQIGSLDVADTNGQRGVPSSGSFAGSHAYADNGVYTITVRLADDDMSGNFTGGVANVDYVESTFTVTISNAAPTLSVTPSATTIDEGRSIDFDALFSDPGFDNPLNPEAEREESFTYSVNWGDGSPAMSPQPVSDSNGSRGNPSTGAFSDSHTYRGDGTYTVTVTVFDDDGGASSATFEVTVRNLPPVPEPRPPYLALRGGEVQLDAMATDPGGDQLTFNWDFDGDGEFDDALNTADPIFPVPGSGGAGEITLRYQVRDGDGGEAIGTAVIQVVSAGGPYSVAEGGSVALTAEPPLALVDSLSYEWDLNGNGQYNEVGDASGRSVVFSAATLNGPDTFWVGLRVSNRTGDQVATTVPIEIRNVAPQFKRLDPGRVDSNGRTVLRGEIEDPGNNERLTLLIEWGDGTATTIELPPGVKEFSVPHQYETDGGSFLTPGVWPIKVTVTDAADQHEGSGDADDPPEPFIPFIDPPAVVPVTSPSTPFVPSIPQTSAQDPPAATVAAFEVPASDGGAGGKYLDGADEGYEPPDEALEAERALQALLSSPRAVRREEIVDTVHALGELELVSLMGFDLGDEPVFVATAPRNPKPPQPAGEPVKPQEDVQRLAVTTEKPVLPDDSRGNSLFWAAIGVSGSLWVGGTWWWRRRRNRLLLERAGSASANTIREI